MDQIISNIRQMGLLRNGLQGLAVIFTLLMPFAAGPEYTDNWNLFFSGILPATAPIIVIVLGLDIMMSSIWRSEAEPDDVVRLTRIIRAHQLVGGLLLGAWLLVFLPALI